MQDSSQRPFLWERGTMCLLPTEPIDFWGVARDISNRGVITGYVGGPTVPVVWSAQQGNLAE